ncbi:MAG: hypothetical protein KIT31_11045 [Deltaproteobacteria bacterium]|nr:hypothetical protein [Deltaproteobacteria bacterium]
MAILNITYMGQSADYELALDAHTSDADIKRIAIEVVRAGGVRGLHVPDLPANAFVSFVVDRLRGTGGEQRIYLRPKVPFGAPARRRCAS